MPNSIVYIPTMTSNFRYSDRIEKLPENILYSPNPKILNVYKSSNITIWDNYTFYLRSKYHKKDKHEVARDHYLWLINYIKNNYIDGITLITPDVEWLKYKEQIEIEWYKYCKDYPQLYVPETWDNPKLNIIGYALRPNTSESYIHKNWNHCLKHKRDISCSLLTYDRTSPL